MSTLVVAGLAAGAAWLAMPAPAARAIAGQVTRRPGASTSPTQQESTARRWLWSALAGVGGWAFVGGSAGALAGAVAAVVVMVILVRAEPPAARRRRLLVRAELPHLVALLASSVKSGLPPADALQLACAALPGPASEALTGLPSRIRLGLDPVSVWRSLESDDALAPLGRTLARSARTGEPVADALDRLGAELAARSRAEVEDAARRVGVQAAVPLGVCLLPAFLLLGVIPIVAGLVGDLTS